MALDSLEKLIARQAIYGNRSFTKPSIANMAAGVMAALWRSSGFPTAGAIPTSAATPTSSITGALPIPSQLSGESLYLVNYGVVSSIALTPFMYDRLAHMGGLSGTVTSAQTVNLDIATAAGQGRCDANGLDVEWYLEWYADTGSTGVTATVSYTNNNNVSGRTSQQISLPATRRASMCYQILPQTDDLAIKSIQSVTLSTTTGTAGNFGVTARRQLAMLNTLPAANYATGKDPFALGFPNFPDTACLEILVFCTGTSTGLTQGEYQVISA